MLQDPENVPIIWIHDYHLMLAATTIRSMAEERDIPCKIGFFLHIPFPPWDMIKIFPWHDLILQGVLGCDLVGFQISDYCLNFIDSCGRGLGCRVEREALLVEHGGRKVARCLALSYIPQLNGRFLCFQSKYLVIHPATLTGQ